MNNTQINTIKEKLKKFRSIFGTPNHSTNQDHKYDWTPDPISFSEIKKIEKYYNIDLPNEYKIFLTKIGNGGLGPTFYPLFPLNKSIQKSGGTKHLKKPFPLNKTWLRCGSKKNYYKDWKPEDFKNTDSINYEESLNNCKNDLIFAKMLKKGEPVEHYIYDLPEGHTETDGTLMIGESGCGLDFHLILNGKHKGEIWHSRDGGMGPKSANFLSFIEEWLNSSLEKEDDKTIRYYIEMNQFMAARSVLNKLENTADPTHTNDNLILFKALIDAKEKKETAIILQLEKLLNEKHPISRVNYLLTACVDHFYENLYSTLKKYTYLEFQKKKKELLDSKIFDWEFNYALNQAKKILSIIPQCDAIILEISLFYYRLKDYKKFQTWSKKIKKDTLFSTNLKGSYALSVTKDFKKAAKLFQHALLIKKDWGPACINLGLTYAYLGKYDDAEKLFNQLIEQDPDYEWPYVGLAENNLLQGKISEAIDWLKIAIVEKCYDPWKIIDDPIWIKCYKHPKYQKLIEEVF